MTKRTLTISAIGCFIVFLITLLVIRQDQILNEKKLQLQEPSLIQNFSNVYTFENYEITPFENGTQVTLNQGSVSVKYLFDKEYNFVGSENNYLPLWDNLNFALVLIGITFPIITLFMFMYLATKKNN